MRLHDTGAVNSCHDKKDHLESTSYKEPKNENAPITFSETSQLSRCLWTVEYGSL